VQLVESLDELFGMLLLLRNNLSERIPQEVSPSNGHVRRVCVETKINKFLIKGALSSKDMREIATFHEGYEVNIVNQIKNLLLTSKNTLDSQEPGYDRCKDLYNTFDNIFYTLILMRYGIENLLFDT
jgi:hypothetical protein